MPRFLEPDDDEPTVLDHWQFDDCASCINRFKPRTCGQCSSGDLYEEIEPEGLDSIIHS